MRVQSFVLDLFQQRVAPFYRTLTTTTDQQTGAFSLGVIDLSSVCVKEHLTDCGVVVIHVLGEPLLGEPLLGHGLLIELDVRLCKEVVLRLTTCVGQGIVSRPHLLGEVHRDLATEVKGS